MATTIQFGENVHAPREHIQDSEEPSVYQLRRRGSRVSTQNFDDGIYNIRMRERSLSRTRTLDIADDDPGLRKQSDYKTKQVFTGRTLFFLAYQSMGVIYGDIGTSPLYVYSSTFLEPPNKQDLVGVLSIVLWSLIMMVTVKYILVIIRMDNNGEGGTFSTYSLLSRYLNITNRDPREASLIQMKRYNTGELEKVGRTMRDKIERSKFVRGLLKVMGVLAVSMVMSDGVLTPAQSVLGAVQGIQVVAPSLSKGVIVGVTDAILICLFFIQPFGVGRLSVCFAPIIMIWLAFNAVFGIYNLVKHDWTVLQAFNPGFGFEYLIRHKTDGWRSLGGILLAFTGVEALFADLGAFSRRAIQISWLGYVFPCLILAYTGQAAFISEFPMAYSNPFFNAAPPGTLYPALIIAILAAIVASQAIITATFQLIAQISKLSYCPQIQVSHTSTTHHGQLYVPIANWLLMLGTILVASVYNNTTSLGNAYGVCVMFVTFFDTTMVSLAAMFVWKIPPYYVAPVWLTIASMDGAFLSSALTKVPQGAWFTLMLSVILASAFILWRFGKESQWRAEAGDRFPTSHYIKKRSDGTLALVERYGGTNMSSIKGFGVFFDKAGETTPIVFSQFAIKLVSAPDVMVFLHLRPLEQPSVPIEERYVVSRLSIPNCYRVVVRHGYGDEIVNRNLAYTIYEVVRDFLLKQGDSRGPLNPLSIGEIPSNLAATVRGTSHIIEGVGRHDVESPPANGHVNDPMDAVISSSTKQTLSSAAARSKGASDANGTKQEDSATSSIHEKTAVELEINKLDEAFEHKILYILGKVQLKITPGTKLWRRVLLSIFLWVRENTRSKIANLRVPTELVVEVGFVKDI